MVQVYKNKLEVSERIRESIGVGQMGPQGDSAELEQLKAKIAQVDAKLVQQQQLSDEASALKIQAEQKLQIVQAELETFQQLALRDPTRNIPLVAKAVRDYLKKKKIQLPDSLLQANPKFDDAITLLRQNAPSLRDLPEDNLYNGIMGACQAIQSHQQNEYQKSGDIGQFTQTLQWQLAQAEMKAQSLQGKFSQIGVYDSNSFVSFKQQISGYMNANSQQSQLIEDLESQLHNQKKQLETANLQYQKQKDEYILAENHRQALQQQQEFMNRDWQIQEQKLAKMEEMLRYQQQELMETNAKIQNLNNENMNLYQQNWNLARNTEMSDVEKERAQQELDQQLAEKQAQINQAAQAIQQMYEMQLEREIEQENQALKLAQQEEKVKTMQEYIEETKQYIQDQENDILDTEYASVTSISHGTIPTKAKPKYAQQRSTAQEFVAQLAGRITSENLQKLPIQPPIIKPLLTFDQVSAQMGAQNPLPNSGPWVTPLSEFTSTKSTNAESFYQSKSKPGFYVSRPGMALPNRVNLDVVPETYDDDAGTEFDNQTQYPQASEPSRPIGAVVMQEVHLAPPLDHVSQMTKAARTSMIGKGVGGNAHQMATDLISDAVKSHKTILSAQQPQADVLSTFANSRASRYQPQGAGARFNKARSQNRDRSSEKRASGSDRADKRNSKSIKRTVVQSTKLKAVKGTPYKKEKLAQSLRNARQPMSASMQEMLRKALEEEKKE